MKDGNELKQKLVGVGKAPPIRAAETPAKPSVVRAAETPAKPSVVRAAETPAKPSVVRPIEERETIEIERRGLAEIYIVRAAPYTDRATLPSSQSTAGRPAAIERTAPNDSNGDSPPGLSAAPGGALTHTEREKAGVEIIASQMWTEPAQQAEQAEPVAGSSKQAETDSAIESEATPVSQRASSRDTPSQNAIREFVRMHPWPNGRPPSNHRIRLAMQGNELWRSIAARYRISQTPPDWRTINAALDR